MNDADIYGSRRRSIVWPLIGLLLAFALGIGLTFYAVRRWTPVAQLVRPLPAQPAAPVLVAPRPLAPPMTAVASSGAAAPDPATQERIDDLEARVEAAEARMAAVGSDADRAEGVMVAFAARRAIDRGQSLGYLEGLLRDHFGAREAASVALAIAAAQRPVTLAQLQDGLAALAPALAAPGKSEDWWSGVKREVGSLFVVRRADQPSAIPDQALGRAEHALAQGQVDTAAAEVARLPGSARAAGWLGLARRYVLAHNALDRLETAALLTPRPDPAAPTPVAP